MYGAGFFPVFLRTSWNSVKASLYFFSFVRSSISLSNFSQLMGIWLQNLFSLGILTFLRRQDLLRNLSMFGVDPKKSNMSRLFIGGLTPDITEQDVKELFQRFGNVESVDLVLDNKVFFLRMPLNLLETVSWVWVHKCPFKFWNSKMLDTLIVVLIV